MPVKRRVAKSRELDSLKIQELWYGPGMCLLAGCGYWLGDFYDRVDEASQARIIEMMREDWDRYSDRVLAAWDARDDHDLRLWREYHSDCPRPWAELRFGARGMAADA